jgi:hypothetical protein
MLCCSSALVVVMQYITETEAWYKYPEQMMDLGVSS